MSHEQATGPPLDSASDPAALSPPGETRLVAPVAMPATGGGTDNWRAPIALATVSLIVAIWFLTRQFLGDGPIRTAIATVMALVPPTLAAFAAIRVGTSRALDPRSRTGWTFVGLGAAAKALSVGSGLGVGLVNAGLGSAMAASFHYLGLVFLIVGLMHWIQGQSVGAAFAIVHDVLAVALLGFMLVWNSGFSELLMENFVTASAGDRATLFLFPLGDILLLMVATAVLGQIGRRDIGGPIVGATLGVGALVIFDQFVLRLLPDAEGMNGLLWLAFSVEDAGNMRDLAWGVGFLLIAFGAERGRLPRKGPNQVPFLERSSTWETIWSIVPFALLASTMLIWGNMDDASPLTRTALVLLTGLLVSRGALVAVHALHVSRAADIDSLTGALTHRAFQEELEQKADIALRQGDSLALIVVDIDDFEKVNDVGGYAGGDRLLRDVAFVLRTALQHGHQLFRSGGDEFALVLPGVDRSEADALAHRLISACANIQTPMRRPAEVSIGVSVLPEHTQDAHELVQFAQGALYWSKVEGQRAVTIYDPEVVTMLDAEERIRKVEQAAQLQAVLALARALDARDAYTARHSQNVATYSAAIARRLGWGEEDVELLRIAGMLHDVGKIGVRDATLRKQTRLTEAEWVEMSEHPILSARVIEGVAPPEIVPWVIAHHERFDGRGYPHGTPGPEISLGARILAVADTFDAMTSSRSYRAGLPLTHAIREIAAGAGSQFDPTIVKTFLTCLQQGEIQVLGSTTPPQTAHESDSVAATLDPEFQPAHTQPIPTRPAVDRHLRIAAVASSSQAIEEQARATSSEHTEDPLVRLFDGEVPTDSTARPLASIWDEPPAEAA